MYMKFMSKYRGYKIALIPARYMLDSLQRRVLVPGKKAIFVDYEFETEDKDMIKLLMENPYYGVDFWSPESKAVNPEAQKIIDQENQSNTQTMTSCPHCSFKAKTNFGLKAHLRARHKVENADV